MDDKQDRQPKITQKTQDAKTKKAKALKSALRDNLRKRKAQARAKASNNE